ncbi:MAG TPA: branched-chain amino acid ABC transporter permease [Caldimonas sp.]|nr:branched-chain amino acid ABC transporter permease [Caldimonas sp.]HEX4235328.1 branched-chain amino acid ABC transporter permease [Caldimonas sp.]
MAATRAATTASIGIVVAHAAVLAIAIALPWLLRALGLDFYLSLASRIVVYAIAATSLNLVLGYAGLVSFGHAAFFGLGAYVTAILVTEGVQSGIVHLAATVAVAAVAALVIGAISLRTRGVYFIMITLAFAQMLFYLANSVKGYGGDEGLNIRARSLFSFGSEVLDLKNPLALYYVALAVLAASLVALARFARSPFGGAALALRDDDVRAEALGFPTYRYKLALFVVAGTLGAIAGALSVNLQGYVSPNALHWTQSGTLMVMVILGGVATVWGGAVGAASLLLLQEVLSSYTEHAEFWTGWVLLAVVLYARQGLVGLWTARR